MKTARLVIKVSPEYQDNIKKKAKSENLSTSDYIRRCLDQGVTEGVTNEHTKVDQSVSVIIDELAVKNEQISKLQEALDQSQQLQAMTEKRYETEHQQLIEMKARSFWQKLVSAFE